MLLYIMNEVAICPQGWTLEGFRFAPLFITRTACRGYTKSLMYDYGILHNNASGKGAQ